MKLEGRRAGVALVLSTALVSGVSIYINRFAVAAVPPNVFTGAKNLLVALAFVAVLFAAREIPTLLRLPRQDWLRLAAIGLIGGSIPFLLFFQGLSMLATSGGGGALASYTHKTMFLYAAVFAFVFLRERMERYLLLATVLFLVGMAAMIAPSLGGSLTGLSLIVLATVFWAGEITLSKATLRRLGPNLVIFGRMGFGSAFIFVFLAATGQLGTFVGLSAPQWEWVLVTSGFLFAYVGTFYHGLKRIDATSATAILTVGAAITLALNAALHGAPVSALQATGMLLILLGTIAIILRALRHPEVEAVAVVPA